MGVIKVRTVFCGHRDMRHLSHHQRRVLERHSRETLCAAWILQWLFAKSYMEDARRGDKQSRASTLEFCRRRGTGQTNKRAVLGLNLTSRAKIAAQVDVGGLLSSGIFALTPITCPSKSDGSVTVDARCARWFLTKRSTSENLYRKW